MKEFNNLIVGMSDEAFKLWTESWFDEQHILDICNSWDIEIKEKETKEMKTCITKARTNELIEMAIERCFQQSGKQISDFLNDDEAKELKKLEEVLKNE